jgi:hypothetical protein
MSEKIEKAGRTEVSLAGRFIGLSIMGSAVLFVMVLEKYGSGEWLPAVKYVLFGALALSIAVPLAFFRRVVVERVTGR